MPVHEAVKNADNWELVHNPVYRNLQQKLNERTAERNAFRAGYLEIIRSIGPDVFDDVPDRFGIKELLIEEQRIQGKLDNITG